MLAEIYNWFTEGFDTKDLQEAQGLLEELNHCVIEPLNHCVIANDWMICSLLNEKMNQSQNDQMKK